MLVQKCLKDRRSRELAKTIVPRKPQLKAGRLKVSTPRPARCVACTTNTTHASRNPALLFESRPAITLCRAPLVVPSRPALIRANLPGGHWQVSWWTLRPCLRREACCAKAPSSRCAALVDACIACAGQLGSRRRRQGGATKTTLPHPCSSWGPRRLLTVADTQLSRTRRVTSSWLRAASSLDSTANTRTADICKAQGTCRRHMRASPSTAACAACGSSGRCATYEGLDLVPSSCRHEDCRRPS